MKQSFESRHGHSNTRRNTGKKSNKKNQRRLEAQERQRIYESLTVENKIALIKSRPGNSTKELAKLVESA